ncbi:MAG TPA: hypothetical protein VK668_23690 [Mucilaginibacter sp.]|nr:hypothetical protein [Mucilaginibacter sp.]
MDLAVYISELLGQQGEVNVPGIGHFAQVRINGYYDERESKFHPPTHTINFEAGADENEGLANYISQKKNISLASSKYFIDKYIIDIKSRVASGKVSIADLGYLYTNGSGLTFKPNEAAGKSDPSFFGLPELKVYKTGEQPATIHTPPEIEETAIVETNETTVKDIPEEVVTDEAVLIPTVITEEETIDEPQEYDEEIDEERAARKRNIWVVTLLITGIVLLSLVGLYQYYPTMFDRFTSKQDTLIGSDKKQVYPVAVPDTAKKAAPKHDTILKTSTQAPIVTPKQIAANPADTSSRGHYEILGGAFTKTSEVEKAINNYKRIGLDARILDNVPGRLHKITLGTYYTAAEAAEAQKKILSTKKVSQKTIYIQYYKPKK